MKAHYDIQQLLKDADMVEVAKEIGIRMKSHTNQTQNIGILCPNPEHADKNFGNCFIRPDGNYECFTCHDRGNVFHMVMQYMGVSFPQALEIVADTCGGREHYILSGKAGEGMDSVALNKKECQLLCMYNSRVYIPVRCGEEERAETGEREKLETWTEQETPIYLIEKCVEKNPLLVLMKSNYECYRDLILTKAQESIELRKDALKSLGRMPEEQDAGWCLEMEEELEQIEDILMKHFPKEPSAKEIRRIIGKGIGKELAIGTEIFPNRFSVPF